jgi:hypothetical protein
MGHLAPQQLGRAFYTSLRDQAVKALAELVPVVGPTAYDVIKGIYDEVEKAQYVTHDDMRAALLALTDEERARLREEALWDSRLLTLDQQNRLRATMVSVEQQLFTQLLAEAEHRDVVAARVETNATAQRLRATLAKQLQQSKYKAALRTANELAALTPYDGDLLRTQQQLEVRLSKTFFQGLAGASIGGLLGGAAFGWLWAIDNWKDSPAAQAVCTMPARFPRYPGECDLFQHPTFHTGEYVDMIIGFGLATAVLATVIFFAVEAPRRLRRRRALRRSGW